MTVWLNWVKKRATFTILPIFKRVAHFFVAIYTLLGDLQKSNSPQLAEWQSPELVLRGCEIQCWLPEMHIRSKNISSKGGKCCKKRKMVVKMILSKNWWKLDFCPNWLDPRHLLTKSPPSPQLRQNFCWFLRVPCIEYLRDAVKNVLADFAH